MTTQGDPGNGLLDRTPPTGRLTVTSLRQRDQKDAGMVDAESLVEQLYDVLGTGVLAQLERVYTHDAELVRYDGAARGRVEIQAFYTRYLATHGTYLLRELTQFRAFDDVVLWDALVETDAGTLMTSDVAIVDGDGRIVRHVPAIRGYWGQ